MQKTEGMLLDLNKRLGAKMENVINFYTSLALEPRLTCTDYKVLGYIGAKTVCKIEVSKALKIHRQNINSSFTKMYSMKILEHKHTIGTRRYFSVDYNYTGKIKSNKPLQLEGQIDIDTILP